MKAGNPKANSFDSLLLHRIDEDSKKERKRERELRQEDISSPWVSQTALCSVALSSVRNH
jgi:hypothetical protein